MFGGYEGQLGKFLRLSKKDNVVTITTSISVINETFSLKRKLFVTTQFVDNVYVGNVSIADFPDDKVLSE